MTAWQPDDHELDAVARSLPTAEAERSRAEEIRTSLLASAAGRTQLPRRSRVPMIALSIAAAAAVVGVLWLTSLRGSTPATTPGSGAPVAVAGKRQFIGKIGNATFQRVSEWPDFVVRLDDGRLTIEVATVGPGERFRVITADAEVEVRGTKFEVAATHGLIAEVVVREGTVEVRADHKVVILHAGETWTAPRTASRDMIELHPTQVASADGAGSGTTVATDTRATTHVGTNHAATAHVEASHPTMETRAPATATDAHATGAHPTDAHPTDAHPTDAHPTETKTTPAEPKPITGVVTAPKPGEDEFRAGWTALRNGDPAAASKLFTTACGKARDDAIGEDACFWAGAAAKRANDTATARTTLARFLDRFPSSARAPEAAALLGWILYDAHDLDGAETQFHKAEHDRVPRVRDSALKGLEAIARSRAP